MLARRASSSGVASSLTPPASPLSPQSPNPPRKPSPVYLRSHSRDEDETEEDNEEEDEEEDEDDEDTDDQEASPGRRRRPKRPLLSRDSPKTMSSPLTTYLRRSANESSNRTLLSLPPLSNTTPTTVPRCTNCFDETTESMRMTFCHCGKTRYCSEHCRAQDFMKSHIKDCPGFMTLTLKGLNANHVVNVISNNASDLDFNKISLKEFYLSEIRHLLDSSASESYLDLVQSQSDSTTESLVSKHDDDDVTFLSISHETSMNQVLSMLKSCKGFVWMDVFCSPFHYFLRAMEPSNNELPRPLWYSAAIRSVIGKLKRFESCLYPALMPLIKTDPWCLLETHGAVSQRKPVFARFTDDALMELEEITRKGEWIRASLLSETDLLEKYLDVDGFRVFRHRPSLLNEYEHIGSHVVNEATIVLLKSALFKYVKSLEEKHVSTPSSTTWTTTTCMGEMYASLGDLKKAQEWFSLACNASEIYFSNLKQNLSSSSSLSNSEQQVNNNTDATNAETEISLRLQRVGLWTSYGYCRQALHNVEDALNAFQRGIDFISTPWSKGDRIEHVLRITKLLDIYGRCLRDARRLEEGKLIFEKSLKEKDNAYKTLGFKTSNLKTVLVLSIASSYTELAGCDAMSGNDALAVLHLSRALESISSIESNTNNTDTPAPTSTALIECLDDLANCLHELAEEGEDEAMEIWRPVVEKITTKFFNIDAQNLTIREVVKILLTNVLEKKRLIYGSSDDRVAVALDNLLTSSYIPLLTTYSYSEDLGFSTSSMEDGVIPMMTTRWTNDMDELENNNLLEQLHTLLLQSCHAHRASRGPNTMSLARSLYQTACVAYFRGHHHEALSGFVSACEIRLRVSSKNVSKIAHVYLDAARSAILSHQHDKAFTLYQTALSASKTKEENEPPTNEEEGNLDEARALFGLAAFAKDDESEKKTYEDCLYVYRKILIGYEKKNEKSTTYLRTLKLELARCLLGLATCPVTLSVDARGMLSESLQILSSLQKQEEEEKDEQVGLTKIDASMALGDCLRESFDDTERALMHYRDAYDSLIALTMIEEVDEILLERRSECIDRIGSTLEDQGKYEDALTSYRECLDLYKKMDNQRGIVYSMDNIASCQKFLGLTEEAARTGKEAWETAERWLGPNDSTTTELKSTWGT